MVERLKLLRNKRGISQQQLADEIGVSQQSVNKYENHKIEPDIHTLMRLADYFETSVDYLIGYSDVASIAVEDSFCEFNENEIRLIAYYRKLSNEKKSCLVELAKLMNE